MTNREWYSHLKIVCLSDRRKPTFADQCKFVILAHLYSQCSSRFPDPSLDLFFRSNDLEKILEACKSDRSHLLESTRQTPLNSAYEYRVQSHELQKLWRAWLHRKSVPAFKRLYSILSIGKNITLTGNAAKLEKEAIASYLETDVIRWDPELARQLNSIAKELIPKRIVVNQEKFRFNHGPGSTADCGRDILVKERAVLRLPLRFAYLMRTYGISPDDDVEWTASQLPARLTTVPKTFDKRRTISMEPAGTMYVQQLFKDWLYDWIKYHPVFSKVIFLENQGYNQALAWAASLNKVHATIDLASASDTIAYDLVKEIFRDTGLYPLIVLARSREIELPDGSLYRMQKYASMGSALCFPIETIIFAMCIIYCWRRHIGPEILDRGFLAYGDDLIIPNSIVHETIDCLTSLGFRVNEEKSYSGQDSFRESCGYDCLDGCIVTPFKISRSFQGFRPIPLKGSRRLTANHLPAAVAFLNRAYKHDSFLHKMCFKLFQELNQSVKFQTEVGDSLLSNNATNFHLPSRWHESYQYEEVQDNWYHPVTAQTSDDEMALRYTLRMMSQRRNAAVLWPDQRVMVSPSVRYLRPVKRWSRS